MISELMNELVSYERYENNQLIYIDDQGKDHFVKDNYSFTEWLMNKQKHPTVKIEGIERNSFISSNFPHIKYNSIHLFIQNKKGFSFDWHEDDTNVCLHIVKGSKKVYIEKEIHKLNMGDNIHIKKGQKHKVESEEDTWALSIGYD